MMVQNVAVHTSTQAGSLIARSTGTQKSSQNAFDMILSNSIGSQPQKATDTQDTSVASKPEPEKTNSEKSENTDVKLIQTKDSEKTAGTKNINVTDEQTGNETDTDIAAVVAGQIVAMIEQIRSAITDVLNVSEEELDQMMQELGLNMTDLLDPEAIKQLVLYNSSGKTDVTLLLFNEQVKETYTNLSMLVENIIKEADLNLPRKEIEKILSNLTNMTDDTELNIDNMVLAKAGDVDQDMKAATAVDDSTDTGKTGVLTDNMEPVSLKFNETSGSNNSNPTDRDENNEDFDFNDGFEAFLNKLEAGYEKPITDFDEDIAGLDNIKEIARQIIEEVRVMAKPGQTTMELQLYPEHLGKVNVTISASEGGMSARFVVQNEMAKEAVEGQMLTLKETLSQQGIKVESIEVTVAGFSFDQNNQANEQDNTPQKNNGNGRKITFEEAINMSEEPTEEAVVRISDGSGLNIDYTA